MKVSILLILLTTIIQVQCQNTTILKHRHKYVMPIKNSGYKPSVAISPSIVGGEVASKEYSPHSVALNLDNKHFCGGSLITNRCIMTAGHCLFLVKKVNVFLGALRWQDLLKRITRIGASIIIHGEYNPNTLNSDIALLFLKEVLPSEYFSTKALIPLKIMNLPKTSEINRKYDGMVATAMGYGKTSDTGSVSPTLNVATNLKVITNAECSAVYGKTVITNRTICCNGAQKSNTCSGDSGGALVVTEKDGRKIQIGIVSFGAAISCSSYPSGFTCVSCFLPWLQKNVPGLKLRK